MNISSVIIRTRPETVATVRDQLIRIPGVEVHAAEPDGRIVATIEDSGRQFAADTYIQLHHVPGVLSAAMVYQYSDDDEEAQR